MDVKLTRSPTPKERGRAGARGMEVSRLLSAARRCRRNSAPTSRGSAANRLPDTRSSRRLVSWPTPASREAARRPSGARDAHPRRQNPL